MKDLDNTDLIMELGQLETFDILAGTYEPNADDFNHCLLEDDVDGFITTIELAVWKFKKAIRARQAAVWKELNRRGITDIEVQ